VLYVIGGYNGNQDLDVNEVYLIDENKWKSKEPMSEPREELGNLLLRRI
jgi:hypothetical protein